MKATNFLRAGLALALCGLVGLAAVAKEPADKAGKRAALAKSTALDKRYAVLNINNITTWLRYDGHSNHSPSADDGMYYPRATGSIIYQDCVAWGGKVFTNAALTTQPSTHPVRIGGGTYGIGTRAGRVILADSGAVPGVGIEDQNSADVKVFRIRRDYYTLKEEELKRDAATVFEVAESGVTSTQANEVKAQYATDWTTWPVAKGAPYIDRNGNGVYDAPPAFNTDATAGTVFTVDSLVAQGWDEPGVAGGDPNSPADQVIWTVYNDLTVSTALAFEGSNPIGLEVQKTVWGYKRTDALGNLYFNRYKLINKGGVDTSAATGNQYGAFWIDSMYVCQWSDPDLGNAGDDLLGSDSLLAMGYCYNGNPVDAEFRGFNLPPPAVGYDFLAGPVYAAPGDSGVFNLKRVYDKKNLGMSSFAYFSAGSPYTDPPGGTGAYLIGSGRWWKMLRGFAPLGDMNTADQPYNHPPGPITQFPLSGNPVTGSGFVDGEGTAWSFAAGDRRLLTNTGPFQMAPGDTQEIYVGVVAGLGADRLTSVAVMKFNDRFVQNTFDALFQVPRAPAPPDVKVAELDGEIILQWGSNLVRVSDTETKTNNPGQYIFEGYNVYQLPSSGSRLREGRRIATFDLPTDPTVILDEQFDQTSGQILNLPVQFGSNSGILRQFQFNRDYLLDINKLYNGQEYYLVVTAYSRTLVPGYLPASLESDPAVLTVRPKTEFGKVFVYSYGDTLTVAHTGPSDGIITPIVNNPAGLTGNSYLVGFDTTGGSMSWYLRNTTTGTDLLTGQTNQSDDDDYPFVDGMQVKVAGPPLQGKSYSYASASPANLSPVYPTFTGGRWFTGGSHGGELFFGGVFMEPNFWGFTTLGPADYKTVELRFSPMQSYTDSNLDGAYSIGEPYVANTPHTQKGYAYTGFSGSTFTGTIDLPFTAWDVSSTPARQLNVVLRDRDNNGQWDLHRQVTDPLLPNGGDQRFNYAWVMSSDYAASGYYGDGTAGSIDVWAGGGIIDGMWTIWWDFRTGGMLAEECTFTMVPNLINTVADQFSFAAPAPQSGTALEKVSADRVGVFPNPYYAFNAAETNRFQRFVTFNNLPPVAKIRIFNLAGQLVRTIDKNDASQFLRWNLANQANFPVASGMYIAHIELTLPADGSIMTKVLKLAVIQEQEILNTY